MVIPCLRCSVKYRCAAERGPLRQACRLFTGRKALLRRLGALPYILACLWGKADLPSGDITKHPVNSAYSVLDESYQVPGYLSEGSPSARCLADLLKVVFERTESFRPDRHHTDPLPAEGGRFLA